MTKNDMRHYFAIIISLLFMTAAVVAQDQGTVAGQVFDPAGRVIANARVEALEGENVVGTATSDAQGEFSLALAPGKYRIRVDAEGFVLSKPPEVTVSAGRTRRVELKLSIATVEERLSVESESAGVSVEPDSTAGAIVLKEKDLEALPDDPDDLAEALQALAGPSAGPEGGQIYIDGFTGGRMPPRSSIREIRMNTNPFSAEHDRLGFGRIEILTKPGTGDWHGQAQFTFTDESFNSRDAFADRRAPFQSRQVSGNISGPVGKRASFFLDVEHRDVDDNAIINARVLDGSLNEVQFRDTILTPLRRTEIGPRFDFQINPANTLTVRYEYESRAQEYGGVGETALLSRASSSENREHSLRLTETAIINNKVVNEVRLQFERGRDTRTPLSSGVAISVLDAFSSGPSLGSQAADRSTRWEAHELVSWTARNHSLKAGARVRRRSVEDVSTANFNGSFTFTSLEQYRATLLNEPGATPAQYMVTLGEPLADVTQFDAGVFLQDDWRMRPDFTVSLGLRYENQTNISDNLNFAPRVAFAWAPGRGPQNQRKTVIRGGAGVFYSRVDDNLTLQARRLNGTSQVQYRVTDPAVLDAIVFTPDGVSNVPTPAELAAFQVPQVRRILAGDIRAPYILQQALSVERQLPKNFQLAVSFVNSRTLHMLRSRNINAPLPGTYDPNVPGSGTRPLGGTNDIHQYESTGTINQQQIMFRLNNRLSRRASLFFGYVLGWARGDTDGAGTFPTNSYDLSSEYGRSTMDVRHRAHFGGSVSLPWSVRLNPFIIASSGRPFNITTGVDTNGDGLFTERPALATNPADPGAIATEWGAFDLTPDPGQPVITRNYGRGPAFATVNLRVSKTFSFGKKPGAEQTAAQSEPAAAGPVHGPGPGMGGGRHGGFGGRGGALGGEEGAGKYSFTLSVQMQNLLNTTNEGTPVGNLSSPFFGQSLSTAGGFGGGPGGAMMNAGNRRIFLQTRFAF